MNLWLDTNFVTEHRLLPARQPGSPAAASPVARRGWAALVVLTVLGATFAPAQPVPVVHPPSPAASTNVFCGYVATSSEIIYLYRPPFFLERMKARADGYRVRLFGRPPPAAPAPQAGAGGVPEERWRTAGLATLALTASVWLGYRLRRRRKPKAAAASALASPMIIHENGVAWPAPRRISSPLPTLPPAGPPVKLSDLHGSLSAIPMGAVLQMLGAENGTGILHIKEPGGGALGQLTLVEGRVRDASAGKKRGRDAVYELVRQRSGEFQFHAEAAPASLGTVQEDLVSLLLEAHRRMDEAGAAAGPRAA